jgi:hypothetical protein
MVGVIFFFILFLPVTLAIGKALRNEEPLPKYTRDGPVERQPAGGRALAVYEIGGTLAAAWAVHEAIEHHERAEWREEWDRNLHQ